MNSINLLQSDGDGNLFIGTNLGLNRYDIQYRKDLIIHREERFHRY